MSSEPKQPRSSAGILPVSVWLTLIAAAGLSGYLAGRPGPKFQMEPTLHSAPQPLQSVSTLGSATPSAGLGIPAQSLKSEVIADIVERAGQFVVHIEVGAKPTVDRPVEHYFFGPPSHINPDTPMPQGRYGSAAGVIIREDGWILTNAHVVRGADEVKVTLTDGREFMAEPVGKDNTADLAVLRIKANDLPTAQFADSSKVRSGQWAIAIGSPYHLDHSVSLGVVSALKRSIGDPFTGVTLIQTDAAINPGSSGGPLLNLNGEVIGINCVMRSDAQNIAFAIPAAVAREVSDCIISGKPVIHNYIGIRMQELHAKSLQDTSPRVLVTFALPDSPAWKAGIRDRDYVKYINGKYMKSIAEVKRTINDTAHDGTINVTLVRNGKERNVDVKVEAMPPKHLQ